MTEATLITKLGPVVIKFIDNPFTQDFIPHFKRIKNTYQLDTFREEIPYRRYPWNPTVIETQRVALVNAISTLNDLGLNFPIPIDDIVLKPDAASRRLLNQLHRRFTTSHDSKYMWNYDTGETFAITPGDELSFAAAVHAINDAVHAVECYYTNDRIRNFPPRTEFQLLFNSSRPIDPTNDPQQDYFQVIKPEHFQYFTDQLEYDVWLPLHQIQGKNYWICYFDEDTPTNWDISTNIIYSGSIAIGDRSSARDPVILDWLRSYGITPGPIHCGMPLGHIVSGKDIAEQLSGGDVEDILINE